MINYTVDNRAYLQFLRYAVDFFKNPENQRKFEEWHLKTFGETYDEWLAKQGKTGVAL